MTANKAFASLKQGGSLRGAPSLLQFGPSCAFRVDRDGALASVLGIRVAAAQRIKIEDDGMNKRNHGFNARGLTTSVLLSAALVLTGCGGGGGGSGSSSGDDSGTSTSYTGTETQAQITSSNAEDLSIAVANGTEQAIVSDASRTNIPGISTSSIDSEPTFQSRAIDAGLAAVQEVNASETVDGVCDSGSVTYETDNSGNTEYSYNSCVIGEYTFNGSVHYESDNTTVTITYDNLTVSGPSFATQTLDGVAYTCTGVGTSSTTCTISNDFTGTDDRVYRVSETTVTEGSSGYSVEAKVYDPNHGYVTITTTTEITLSDSCTYPQTGVVEVSGNGSSAQLTFQCDNMSLVINGGSSILIE
ncbi:hypothetical protein QQM79_07500 [Marinobacteraceae bacterium S3BR75-40.1]